MKKEELTYEILEKRFREQDRLIAENKMQKPQIVYGLDEESLKAVREGWTLEKTIKEIERKHRKI